MARTEKVQTEPGDTQAPQQTTDAAKLGAVELLALAGDENARRALGQPTASGDLSASPAGTAQGEGFAQGQTAPESVYQDLDGKIVRGVEANGEGFRGTVLVAKGDVVPASAAALLATEA